MRPMIFVTRSIPTEGLSLLREAGFRTVIAPQHKPITRAALLKGVKGAYAIISLLTDKIDAAVMDAAGPQLKVVANYAVGFDNIDLAAAKKRGIFVTNTPGVLTQTVAEHTISLMMAVANRLVEADAFMRKGKYKGWEPDLLIGREFHRKTIGIIGAGRIGYTVAKIAHDGLGMMVHYSNPSPELSFETEFSAKRLSLEELLKTSDFVTLHVPLLPSTKHLIGAKQLSLMKKTAFLVNTSRGPVIDESALVHALRKKQIAGAGLDVFEFEPKLAPGLAKLPNVILTPHIASATYEARAEMAKLAAQNVIDALAGRQPSAIVYTH